MKDIVINVAVSVLCVFIGSVCYYVSKIFHEKCEQLKQKTKNESLISLIDKIDKVVQVCVEATNQTFVTDLKKSGNFTENNKEEAFNQTFSYISSMLTDSDKQQIIDSFGDVPTFIKTSVETYIKNSKNVVE